MEAEKEVEIETVEAEKEVEIETVEAENWRLRGQWKQRSVN